jgi:filamentous hemagglutinin family protein
MKGCHLRFGLLKSSVLFCLSVAHPTAAQIVPDATLPNNSTVKLQGTTSIIEGGTTAGGNLFHSFREFSVPIGGEAFFNNTGDIQNIFSRVTGSSISNIDGLIRANGVANLFLLNPNGIIFGPNASLNIGGSFLVSTANSLRFADGILFSASPGQTTPLLTINVPVGLQYGGTAGEIRIQGSGQNLVGATGSFDSSLGGLRVSTGQTLALVGGNVIVDGGILQGSGGRIELGGLAASGEIGFNSDGSLSFPEGVRRSDIFIINKAGINVIDKGGGSIAVTAQNLEISGNSLLSAGIGTGFGSIDSQPGDIALNATGAITIQSSIVENNVSPDATGNSGSIEITTGSLLVKEGFGLSSSTFGLGNAGSITIEARDKVSFDGSSVAFSTVEYSGKGDGGDINIITGSLLVAGGVQLQTLSRGLGNAGDITITARDTVSFDGASSNGKNSSAALSSVEALGNGGDINITTGSLRVTNGATLSASTFGFGNAGTVTITAHDTVSFKGEGAAFSIVGEKALGNGGDINITAGSLFVTGGAQLDVSTNGLGKAGTMTITARDTVSLDGESSNGFTSAAFSAVREKALGDGGDIKIATGSLFVTGGGVLTASTKGQGKAGGITIIARDTVLLDGESSDGLPSSAFSSVEQNAIGNGSDIKITTGSLRVTNGATLSAGSRGQGKAGNIVITARDTVLFDGVSSNGFPSSAFSTVEDIGKGNGGNIEIVTESLLVTGGARLVASTNGQGKAGDVTINARDTVFFDGESGVFSTVEASAKGDGGGINITTGSLLVTGGAQLLTINRGQGKAGSITINARDTVSFDGESRDGFRSAAISRVSREKGDAVGDGGDINITTGSVSLTRGALLDASTFGQGKAGSISIIARDRVSFDGKSVAFSGVGNRALGDGGNINITTSSLSLTGVALLVTSTGGRGKAGIITINAYDTVSLDGNSAAFSTVEDKGTGDGGGINITTASLRVINSSTVSTTSRGNGKAGNINLQADSIRLDNGSDISSDTVAGQGNITVRSSGLILRRGSLITTNATGSEIEGGNITLDTGVLAALENSDIRANSEEAKGGRVIINTQAIFGTQFRQAPIFDTPESDITATGGGGRPELSGTVEINTPDVDPSSGLIDLPTNLVDVTGLIAPDCPIGTRYAANEFFITGRGGLPPNPREALANNALEVDWVTPNTQEQRSRGAGEQMRRGAEEPPSTEIVEATGWVRGANGEVILTANPPTATSRETWYRSILCPAPRLNN